MVIDIVPIWVLFLFVAGLVLLAVEIGFRMGRTVRGKTDAERESPASSISGVILGLQAFMLAFTFGIVSDRYDSKKALVREEANAIRVAWRRADFLPEPEKARTKTLLAEYVDQRIALAESRDFGLVDKALDSAGRIQQELWDIAVSTGQREDSVMGFLFVESVNEIERLHSSRAGLALYARIPTAIWAVLLSLLTLGMTGLGYYTAIADSRRSRVLPVLAAAFALVIVLIAALDHPGDTIMPVSQQPLVDVLSQMSTAPATYNSNQQ